MTQDVPYSTRVAIDNLINRYARSLDGRQESEFVSLWTDGCCFTAMGTDFRGHKALSTFLKGTFDGLKFSKHWTANYDMVLAADGSVEGHGSAFAITVDNDNKTILSSGHYTDKFVESNGRWAFLKRQVVMQISVDIATGVPTLV